MHTEISTTVLFKVPIHLVVSQALISTQSVSVEAVCSFGAVLVNLRNVSAQRLSNTVIVLDPRRVNFGHHNQDAGVAQWCLEIRIESVHCRGRSTAPTGTHFPRNAVSTLSLRETGHSLNATIVGRVHHTSKVCRQYVHPKVDISTTSFDKQLENNLET